MIDIISNIDFNFVFYFLLIIYFFSAPIYLIFFYSFPQEKPWRGIAVLVGELLTFMIFCAHAYYLGKYGFNHAGHVRGSVNEELAVKRPEDTRLARDPTLEALWDKLTKSRINLDGEEESAPLADPEDEAAKRAVGKTFGLGEQGKLPPNWVIHPPKVVGQVYRESVASDPFVSEAECRRQLELEQLPEAVSRRIAHLAASQMGHPVTIANPLEVGIGPDYILREVCRDEFVATVDSSVGEMKKIHVLLEFNPQVDLHLTSAWLRHERQQRLAAFGKIVAMSLAGLGAVYGLLRFDTWSKGYYSKQLLVGGVLAIIALAVVFLKS